MLSRTIKTLKVITLITVGFAGNVQADTDPVLGTWRTEAADSGGYLYVNIAPCDNRICGTIEKAFNKDDEEGVDYIHLGKMMLTGMEKKANGKYANGKIWAPDKDKTYQSKMKIENGKLMVSGCVLFICRSQVWTRVDR